MKHLKQKKWFGLTAAALCLAVLLTLGLNTSLAVRRYTLHSAKITAPARIALVTDLHSCYWGPGMEDLTGALNAQGPDLVLLGGDICDDGIPHTNTEIFLQAVSGRYPLYYVSGNHEFWSGSADKIKELFRSYGVHVLEGDSVELFPGGQPLILSGIDDPFAGEEVVQQQLERTAETVDGKAFTLLLAHRPERFPSYAPYGFDLVLSGHAHGGQWRIPGLQGGLVAPDQGWFPKYAGGIYERAGSTMIVSRGLSRETTRVPRIFNRPELVIVDLVP